MSIDHTSYIGNVTADAARFAEAIEVANVPTLLMVLVQLTGDSEVA